MLCGYCENKLMDGATFCIKCGKRVASMDTPVEPVPRTYPASDAGIENRDRRYIADKKGINPHQRLKKQGRKKMYFILSGVLILLLIGGYLIFAAIAGARPFYDRKPITANEFYLHYKAVDDLQVTNDDFGYLPLKSTTTVCYKAYNSDINLWFYEFSSEGEARDSIKSLIAKYPDR